MSARYLFSLIIFCFPCILLADQAAGDAEGKFSFPLFKSCSIESVCWDSIGGKLHLLSSDHIKDRELLQCYKALSEKPECLSATYRLEEELGFRANNYRRLYRSLSLKEISPFLVKTSTGSQTIDENQVKVGYNRIRSSIPLANEISNTALHQNFNDYGRYSFKFNIGYEYTGINSLKGSSFPRVGFFTYNKSYWIHFYGSARLTSSAEKTQEVCDDSASNLECSDADSIKNGTNAFEAEGLMYLPLSLSRFYIAPKMYQEFGLVASISGAKQNDVRNFVFSSYVGIRSAVNPEHYLDLRIGRIDDDHGWRLDIRGQMPVYRYNNGSRLYLGYNFNTSATEDENNIDVIRFYVSWDVDIANLMGSSLFPVSEPTTMDDMAQAAPQLVSDN